MLGMILYLVPGHSIRKTRDIRIIPIDQYTRSFFFEDGRQELQGPEHVGFLSCPCMGGAAVEAVDEDDIDIAATVGEVDLGQAVSMDLGDGKPTGRGSLELWSAPLHVMFK